MNETTSEHPLVARLYDPVMALPEQLVLGPHREALTAGVSGSVLDLGTGTGVLLPYFADNPEEMPDVTAVEPDPHMRAQARDRASDLSIEVDIVDAGGEALPFADNAFETVCASFVFCTIPNHERALSEVARVLKPGGEFRFLEHVRGEDIAGIAHDIFAPCWHAVAGGCNLNRETDRLFLTDDRFRTVEFERSEGIAGTVLPVVRGRLVCRPQSLRDRLLPSKWIS
ncbi:class I SAM-dependent methyltransferase [Halovenus rubra]|uniref:Class I SAM-dependent methyltransferase n=2 Tax=Halovenus rubra TaxID=869890 RepID=A0ACC7E3Y4_9EURY|nr:class I SAM-dependent methyltransferase [Halovenus rubra]